MVRYALLIFQANVIEILLMLGSRQWRLCGWEARHWALHILSLSFLHLFLPPLTISDSILNGTKYNAQLSLIILRLSDLFLISEICEVSLLAVIVDIVLDDPLTDQVWCPVDVVLRQFGLRARGSSS